MPHRRSKRGQNRSDSLAPGGSQLITVRASDFGDESVSTKQPELSAHPGRAAAGFLRRVAGAGKEDGSQIPVAESGEGELAAADGLQ